MTEPLDIQQKLDDWLAANPAAQQYVSKLWFVPDGDDPPADVTHLLELSSATSDERGLTVGAVVLAPFAGFLDALLALIATQP